jgi:hypothetical protein
MPLRVNSGDRYRVADPATTFATRESPCPTCSSAAVTVAMHSCQFCELCFGQFLEIHKPSPGILHAAPVRIPFRDACDQPNDDPIHPSGRGHSY